MTKRKDSGPRATRATEPLQTSRDGSPLTSAPTVPGAKVEPPRAAWERQDDLVSSAPSPTSRPTSSTSGSVTLSGDRVSEELAREVLSRRFAQEGLAVQADYQFRDGDTLILLDGYDPKRRIGYQYVSHLDADVITDFDAAAETTLRELAAQGRAFILVIHDTDAPTVDDLLARVEAFFLHLDRTFPEN